MQTRLQSLVEIITNQLTGYGVSWLAYIYILPFFGFHVKAGQALGLVLIFAVLSIVRSYLLRRFFNWLHR